MPAAAAITTEFIAANGLTFEVSTCGTGPKLALCLHGFPESAYSWRYQLSLLAELGYPMTSQETGLAPSREYGDETKSPVIWPYGAGARR